jgi:hypothetical protein
VSWKHFTVLVQVLSLLPAFGYLGNNAQAHDLAIGLFMSWFPVLILCSIVDRNPAAADDIQRRLNKLVDLVCISLQDEAVRNEFVASFRDLPESHTMAYWVQKIATQAEDIKGDYFQGFAGQGRVRFHYGAAHAILMDIEKAYLAEHGRNWLLTEREARASLVLGQVDRGLVWFDGRQFWQIASAIICVAGTGTGAFILSYFTPTVGLSCRSGGYLIFNVIALALLIIELTIWIWTSPIRHQRAKEGPNTSISNVGSQISNTSMLADSKSRFAQFLRMLEQFLVKVATFITRLLPAKTRSAKSRKVETITRRHFSALQQLTPRQWAERCFFTPIEGINTIWLVYLIMSQATGAFNNCSCKTSRWETGAGYLDFTQWSYSNSPLVGHYWIAGTAISSCFMGVGMIYVIIEVSA